MEMMTAKEYRFQDSLDADIYIIGNLSPAARIERDVRFKGKYFDLQKDSTGYYFISKIDRKEFGRDSFWKQRRELSEIISHMGCDCSSEDLIRLVIRSCLAVMKANSSQKDYYDLVLESSHNQFVSEMKRYDDGKRYDPRDNRLGDADYSHIRLFSWIYYNELNAIRRISARNEGKNVNVLELGSSFGNSIFSKDELLKDKKDYIDHIEYYGVDICPELIECSRRFAGRKKMDNVHFLCGNIMEPYLIRTGFGMDEFDIVTSSHVIEHIDREPQDLLSEWLELTAESLIISVPYDEGDSDKISDHKRTFSKASLEDISECIMKRDHSISADMSELESGIIMFNRK